MGGGHRPSVGQHWLEFPEIKDTGKTKVWQVKSMFEYDKSDIIVGIVKWYGGWRRYVFYPLPDTLYDVKCMNEISKFIKEEMDKRKKKKSKKGGK